MQSQLSQDASSTVVSQSKNSSPSFPKGNVIKTAQAKPDKTVKSKTSGSATSRAGNTGKPGWFEQMLRKYMGALVGISVAIPVVMSATTVCFYLAPPIPFLDLNKSNWYAPIYGLLCACIIFLLFVFFFRNFSSVRNANMHVYGMLTRYHSELKGRLGEPDEPDGKECPPEVLDAFGIEQDKCTPAALREAHEAYYDLYHHLFTYDSGTQWTLGTGYIHAWRMVHRVQEALIEVEPLSKVIGDAIHDARAIQNSKIPDRIALTRKLLHAVRIISPRSLIYFEDLKGENNVTDIFSDNISNRHNLLDIAREKLMNNNHNKQNDHVICPPDAESEARGALRQVKHALNAYQDSLWSALVRVRNYLSASIVVTGLVTHLLLCMIILLDPNPGSNDLYRSAIVTAVAYYITGAVAGLFGRFYNEAHSENAPDDYGLFLSRLAATPSLSGLAAIGGVLFTNALLHGEPLPALNTIFSGAPTLENLLAAAIFGFAPNLIMASFQQRTQRYATDLQNTKGEASRAN